MSVHIYAPLEWQRKLGYKVDHTRCRAAVHLGREGRVGFRQCAKEPVRVVGNVWFCGTHATMKEKERKR